MGRRRINIDFGHTGYAWLADTAARLGITRTELCRQLVLQAMTHGLNDQQIKAGAIEDRQSANRARAQSQTERHRPQPQ